MKKATIQSTSAASAASAIAITPANPVITACTQFALVDLFKMLCAAVLSGLVFSAIAAGVTLLLMNSAEARGATKSGGGAIASSSIAKRMAMSETVPGVFSIGDGCERTAIEAMDRDWRIRIHASVEHDIAEIRVMQSYALPFAKSNAEFDSPGRTAKNSYVANFYARLPVDAVLLSFRADTDAAASVAPQIAKLMTHQALANMSSAAMRALRKSNQLVVLTNGRQLESDSILNLTPGETVTVEYTYTMPVEKFNHDGAFVLNIVLQGEASPLTPLISTPATASTSATPASTPTTGTVWVEWLDAHPTQVTSTANDIFIERVSHDAENGNGPADADVVGASWFSPDLSVAPQFALRWNRPPSVAAVNTSSHISLRPAAESR